MECVGEGKGMEGNRWEEKKERYRQERNGRKWKKGCNWDSVAKGTAVLNSQTTNN